MNLAKCLRVAFRRVSTSSEPVKTSLHELHARNGGKLVDFAGYYLPVQYEGQSITSSHLHTRSQCSLFDVSHMLQTRVHGKDGVELMERLTTADVQGLQQGRSCLTVFTDPSGGILDDLIITKAHEGYLYVVSNAGRRQHDQGLIKRTEEVMKKEGKDISVEFLDLADYSLIALQGPATVTVLQPLSSIPLDKLVFMSSAEGTIGGIPRCRVSRCGYTGEDGVEVSVPSSRAAELVELLLLQKAVRLAGLGARDSLRLEAGLCLYGSDIDHTVTPVEASLSWLVAKVRRQRKDFPGADVILSQLSTGVSSKRVGIKLEKGPPARHDCALLDTEDQVVGRVTSGCPSPSLGGSVAMGYLATKLSKPDNKVQVEIRGKKYPAHVTRMPFIPCKYYSP